MSRAPPLKHGKLECYGNGLTFASHLRVSPSTLAVQTGLQPKLTPSGRISKNQTLEKRPKSWWEAQVRLYGLKCSKWTVEGCKEVLKTALEKGLTVSADLQRVEERLDREYGLANAEFQKQIAAEKNEKYITLTTDVQKANYDPKRFLGETVVKGGIKVLRGLNSRASVHQAAEQLGLFSTSTDGPDGGYDGRILVVGRNSDEVWREIHRIGREVKVKQVAMRQERADETEERHQKLLKTGDGGDVSGQWVLDMPEVTSSYADGDITMDIAPLDDCGNAYGKFDLQILEGVVKFYWGGPKSVRQAWRGKPRKFTWRGRETGEGVIQYDDASHQGAITFTSASECHGIWVSDYGNFEFTGVKIGTQSSTTVEECEDEYDTYTGEAYEYARVNRWK